jgi:hypothetical protein
VSTYRFDITADLRDAREIMSTIVFRDFTKVVGYMVREGGILKTWEGVREVPKRLILCWAKSSARDYVEFPETLSLEESLDFLIYWLELNDPDEKEPDIDGTVRRGFRIYNESWGHIENDHYAFVAATPTWAEYGK